MKKFILFLVLIPLLGFANYTLHDVIEACPQVANSTPSLLTVPCGGKGIIINGKVYELRLFTYEKKGLAQADTPTFKSFISEWKQLSATPLQRSESLIPTDYFSATAEQKEKGFFFLLALREVTDPKLVSQLKVR